MVEVTKLKLSVYVLDNNVVVKTLNFSERRGKLN